MGKRYSFVMVRKDTDPPWLGGSLEMGVRLRQTLEQEVSIMEAM